MDCFNTVMWSNGHQLYMLLTILIILSYLNRIVHVTCQLASLVYLFFLTLRIEQTKQSYQESLKLKSLTLFLNPDSDKFF